MTPAALESAAIAHIPLARAEARRFVAARLKGRDYGEFEGVAIATLWVAAASFDDTAGCGFAGWCRRKIRWAMQDHRRWLMDHPAEYGDLPEPSRYDMSLAAVDAADDVDRLIRSMPSNRRRVASLLLVDRLGVAEAAARAGVSKGHASRIRSEMLGRIK